MSNASQGTLGAIQDLESPGRILGGQIHGDEHGCWAKRGYIPWDLTVISGDFP